MLSMQLSNHTTDTYVVCVAGRRYQTT